MNKKEIREKILIEDKSGWDPFIWSISNNYLTSKRINDFFISQDITSVITQEALDVGEFKHSYNPNLFSGNIDKYNKNESFCFSELDGSLTKKSLDSYGLEVSIESASQLARSTNNFLENKQNDLNAGVFDDIGMCSNDQFNLWESTSFWRHLSFSDKSVVRLQRNFAARYSSTSVASLVNDWCLREQIKTEGYQVYGSVSMLAGMVFVGNLSTQKATQIFYKWKEFDSKWVPRDLSFREVLSIERNRVENGTSFWVN